MIPINVTIQYLHRGTKEVRRTRLMMDETVEKAVGDLVAELGLPQADYHLMRGRQVMDSGRRLYEENVQEGDILQIIALDPNATVSGKISLGGLLNRAGGSGAQAAANNLPDGLNAELVSSNGVVFTLRHVRATIGRADAKLGFPAEALDADLTLLDPQRTVSRPHALIIYKPEDGSFSIRDLYSQLGVFINGQRAPVNTSQVVRDGDVLQFGDVKLTFRVG